MKRKFNEDINDEITVFMNTWQNYNENGADDGVTPTGWMSVDEAKDYVEQYADYEPFINDVDNPTSFDLEINEYGNVLEDLDIIESINNLSDYEKEVLSAIWNNQGGSFNDSKELFDNGDYQFYSGISDYGDLARQLIDDLGGISNAVTEPSNYIDEEALRNSYRDPAEEILRDSAVSDIANEEDIEEADVSEEMIEDYIAENIDSFLESIVDEEISLAEMGEIDLSDFFDYDKFGRDLSFDGWSIEPTGAILF